MQIVLKDQMLQECLNEFNLLNPEERLSMSCYDLAEETNIKEYERWMNFLQNPAVAEQIEAEFNLYIQAQQRKLVQTTTIDDKSVGKAQLITALGKTASESQASGGNLFVYSYVPLNANEKKRPHTEFDTDIMDT